MVTLTSNNLIELVNIYDVRGQLIFNKSIHSYTTQLNIENFSKGLYWVEVIQSNGEVLSKKLLKE